MEERMGILEAFRNRIFGESKKRPEARRVAARAMVLSTIVCRSYLEQENRDGDHKNAEGYMGLLYWLEESKILSELEDDERRFLETRPGAASNQAMYDAFWRAEGLGVLAWALGRFELPPYDEPTNPDAAQQAVGFLKSRREMDLRKSGMLRPDADIGRFSTHATIVSWRLRQFTAGQDSPLFRDATEAFGAGRSGVAEPMDFVGFLRSYHNFKERWLEDIRIIDGDLAIRDTSIAEAPRDHVKGCMSIALERQIAAYWLEGSSRIYSQVNPMTLLSACVE
jgi:hypothetical protein